MRRVERLVASNTSVSFSSEERADVQKVPEPSKLELKSVPSVVFGTVQVRCYPVIVGDNPSVSAGPPLSIDWEHMSSSEYDLERFERSRSGRRESFSLKIPPYIRNEILDRCGECLDEIYERVREVRTAKEQRELTLRNLVWSGIHESTEKFQRGLKNATTGRREKMKQRLMMKESMKCQQQQRTEADRLAETINAQTVANYTIKMST